MSGLASLYPPPPAYYKAFTDENVAEAETVGEPVPTHLEYLFPPPPPDSAKYRGFGSIWNTHESLLPLAEAGVPQLYEEFTDGYARLVAELKKLLRSALVSFLTLVGILSVNPEEFPKRIEELRVIIVNMHHLLNIYRPHQTRESLIMLMSRQIENTRQEIDELEATNATIEKRMKDLVQRLPKSAREPTSAGKDLGAWNGLELDVDRKSAHDVVFSGGVLEDVQEESENEMAIG